MIVTAHLLTAIMPTLPSERAAVWLPPLQQAMAEFRVDAPRRAAAFLAQAAHESGELARLVESLMYSAKRLRAVWPSRFPDDATAARFAGRPQAIAERVYGGRLGNLPEGSGDGARYIGRGLLQLTGRDMYRAAGKALGLDLIACPELLERPEVASRASCWYWRQRGLNQLADVGGEGSFRRITIALNGGLNGWESRLAYWHRACDALELPT